MRDTGEMRDVAPRAMHGVRRPSVPASFALCARPLVSSLYVLTCYAFTCSFLHKVTAFFPKTVVLYTVRLYERETWNDVMNFAADASRTARRGWRAALGPQPPIAGARARVILRTSWVACARASKLREHTCGVQVYRRRAGGQTAEAARHETNGLPKSRRTA